MTFRLFPSRELRSLAITSAAAMLLAAFQAPAAFTCTVTPSKGASAVSPSAPVVFRFSEAVDQGSAMIMFINGAAPLMNVTTAWSADSKVATCSASPEFPSAASIQWFFDVVSSESSDELQDFGAFVTSGGDCTNYLGSFTVAKGSFWKQDAETAPWRDTNTPFALVLCSTLACTNWTATNLLVTFPPGGTLPVGATMPGHYNLTQTYPSSSSLDAACPAGNYTFTVQGPSFNLPFQVAYPASLVPGSAPFITNYAAAQAIDPALDFVLGWGPFSQRVTPGVISVEIYGGIFRTPSLGEPGALNGSTTGVRIPAGTLASNTSYQGAVTFYDYVIQTNPNSINLTYYSAVTEFSLAASDGTPPLRITSLSTTFPFSFELDTVPGQTLTIKWSPSLSPDYSQWQTLLTTNAPGTRVRIVDPASPGAGSRFYIVKKGT